MTRALAVIAALSLASGCSHGVSDVAATHDAHLWPAPGPVPVNVAWLLIDDDATPNALLLRGPDGEQPVSVRWFHGTGPHEVLVAPTQPLAPGSRVTLEVRDPKSDRSAFARLPANERTWTVSAASPPPPRWLGAPSVEEQRCNWLRRRINYCPPEYIDLRLPIQPADHVRVHVRVQGAGNEVHDAILLSEPADEADAPATVSIQGKFTWGGPLPLRKDVHYQAQVTLVDISGHEIPAPGGPLDVVGL